MNTAAITATTSQPPSPAPYLPSIQTRSRTVIAYTCPDIISLVAYRVTRALWSS